MKKSVPVAIIVVVLLAAVLLAMRMNTGGNAPAGYASYKSASYEIDGKQVVLGAEGTKFFGNEATGDLNGDGKPDMAFLFTSEPGGSGTFYYVAVALKTADGYSGTNAVLLGDRIAPQNTQIDSGDVIVNYADRNGNEPMSARPSVGVTSYFKIAGGKLVFEGSR